MTLRECEWRRWVMGMAHMLYRRSGTTEPFGRCLSKAWAMAKELRAREGERAGLSEARGTTTGSHRMARATRRRVTSRCGASGFATSLAP